MKTKTKQTTRTGTESEKWALHGGFSVGRGRGKNWEKGTGNKKHKRQVQNRQVEVQNSIGNGEAKELICTTHGHELRQVGMSVGGEVPGRREQGAGKNGTTVIA